MEHGEIEPVLGVAESQDGFAMHEIKHQLFQPCMSTVIRLRASADLSVFQQPKITLAGGMHLDKHQITEALKKSTTITIQIS
jgi:hypothetical protein